MVVENFKRETEYCTFCPKMCRFVCPTGIAEARETVTPTGKQTLLYLIQKGSVALNEESAAVFYQCTGCGLCQQYCDHDINVYPVMEAVRAAAVQSKVIIPEARRVLETMLRHGNAYGDLAALYKAKAAGRMVKGAQVYYIPDASTLNADMANLDYAHAVFNKLGAENMAMWPGPLSSGYELLTLGFVAEFAAHARMFAETAAGARTLVFASAQDHQTVKTEYGRHGIDIKAELLSEAEWLRRALTGGAFPPAKPRRVFYHDPCALGRGLGEYDGPRELIHMLNGSPVLEFAWSRDDSKCCGYGGGYAHTAPQSALAVARARLDETAEKPFDEIVAGSQPCATMLQKANEGGARIFTLMSWVAQRLA